MACQDSTGPAGVEPWDTERAAERAVEALRWLTRYYSECAASEALHLHEGAANAEAMAGEERGGAA
jgi:hypothetical protein